MGRKYSRKQKRSICSDRAHKVKRNFMTLSRLVDKAHACAHNAHAEPVSIANELLNKLQISQAESS